jgi:hypothetical protein
MVVMLPDVTDVNYHRVTEDNLISSKTTPWSLLDIMSSDPVTRVFLGCCMVIVVDV